MSKFLSNTSKKGDDEDTTKNTADQAIATITEVAKENIAILGGVNYQNKLNSSYGISNNNNNNRVEKKKVRENNIMEEELSLDEGHPQI